MEEESCKSSVDSVLEINNQEVGFSANVLKKKSKLPKTKKTLLKYGVEPAIDCEIDDDGDEPDYSRYVLKRPINQDHHLEGNIFLPYGVGPDIDCEIDDDNDEPDFLSYTLVPNVNIVEDTSTFTPRDSVA